jgi:hypothetical protein
MPFGTMGEVLAGLDPRAAAYDPAATAAAGLS